MLSLTVLTLGLAAPNPELPPGANSESPAELAAWIDQRLDAAWEQKGVAPRPVAGDEIFLRRAYLELTGTIPSVSQARDFLGESSPSKRGLLVNRLIRDRKFDEHYAALWARTLAPAGESRSPLTAWLRDEFRKDTPFDEIARQMITATGNSTTPSPASFYFAVGNTPEQVTDNVARGLLGIRIGCAQCHDHPFTEWKEEDFWGMAAFFAGTGSNNGVVADTFVTTITPTNSTKEYNAKFLIGETPELTSKRSPRAVLAEWLTSPDNDYFAANVVNRV